VSIHRTNTRWFVTAVIIAFLLPLASIRNASASGEEEQDFFEKKIRPILVEKCYACHSSQLKNPMGGLRLDSTEALLRGGDSGPLLAPGDPEKSLLIKAISYQDLRLKMPPKGKLSDEEIAAFASWVKMGGPGPGAAGASATVSLASSGPFDPDKARAFWCFRPPRESALPYVKQKDWPRSPIDYFILAKLEDKGLAPAPAADKYTWLRRVTMDLTGLPPTAHEIENFVTDASQDACAKVVDRLLASPHYGERWARHWLDLVRFAETNGHEFDNDKLDAWRYRDYVIRAFNEDVPYNQFVREHIAGDLLPGKRLSADGSHWESPLGTSFYWFGEVVNSATDSVKSRADEVDNQIDVLSKAFLGLTVACARCHDHKFDPVPAADYYALAGIMHSTGITENVIDSPSRAAAIASLRQQISDTNAQIKKLLRPAQRKLAQQIKPYLLAAVRNLAEEDAEHSPPEDAPPKARGLSPNLLKAWRTSLAQAREEPENVFYPFVAVADRLARDRSTSVRDAIMDLRKDLDERIARSSPIHPEQKRRGDITFEDFEGLTYETWAVSGQAFGECPHRSLAPNQCLRGYRGQGLANSFGGGSDRIVGSLTSAKFKMPKLYVHVRMTGSKEKPAGERTPLRFTVVADGHKSQHLIPDGAAHLQWKTVRMTKEIGRLCYFEIVDRSREGHIVIDKIVLSDVKDPPPLASSPDPHILALLSRPGINSLESLAEAYQELFSSAFQAAESANASALIEALNPAGRLEDLSIFLPSETVAECVRLKERRSSLDSRIPESAFAMIARDENPRDVRVHIRGNHKNLGDEVPRRFLQVVAGSDQSPVLHGSGRLPLAEWIARRENPLTARVLVNRIWKHHFGQGIVRSLDNFGKTGEEPTHPELLDFLANRFVEAGWSVKALHRMLVLSSAYAMSSSPSEAALRSDPQNRLLQHMPVQRLEGETVRDSILAIAGTLDRHLYGPSVTPYISKYQDGRGKPEPGPLDGNGRRSVYIQVRRNFITPMFLAFDYPLPISTIGSRSTSTVPAQALMMLNNELVAFQAQQWARRIVAEEGDSRRRVERMFLSAFGRPAEEWEIKETLAFVKTQKSSYDSAQDPGVASNDTLDAWSDLSHVLMNSAEFIYVR